MTFEKKYNNSKLKFYIGDVRDSQSVETAMRDVDYVFHAAALKQVPSCEFFPVEAVKTNVIGTENVLQSAIHQNVKKKSYVYLQIRQRILLMLWVFQKQ